MIISVKIKDYNLRFHIILLTSDFFSLKKIKIQLQQKKKILQANKFVIQNTICNFFLFLTLNIYLNTFKTVFKQNLKKSLHANID